LIHWNHATRGLLAPGMCVINTHGIIRDVNTYYCALYGYAQEELVGQLFTFIYEPAEQQCVLALHGAIKSDST
jgi:PAS domain S-box-containing protein